MKVMAMVILVSVFIILSLWFWAIHNITKSRFKKRFLRTTWLFVVLFYPFEGSILYLIFKKKDIIQKHIRFQPKFNKH